MVESITKRGGEGNVKFEKCISFTFFLIYLKISPGISHEKFFQWVPISGRSFRLHLGVT